ncbi:MAG: hypothetical protein JO307_13395 [Bryobacterales bacterium]|nr:hypothetical protein [Bryobacterales bacterium]MBV9401502.1 hypothetical protein [Bryobacterales bacterium]
MKTRNAGPVLIAVLAAAGIALIPLRSAAQNQNKAPAAPTGPTPRMADGKPDLQGVWNPGLTFMNVGQPSLQPWAEALYKERRANLSKDDPEGHCLPAGVPRISPFPQKVVQTPTLVVILDEGNIHSYRQIFLDGRKHLEDSGPLWMGDSTGKWDGDTLVVDTVNFNDKTWLNGQGLPHSEELHVIERYSRPDLGHLNVEITLDDPKTFTKPHTFKRAFTLMANAEILEYVCNEFNVDAEHLVGK